MHHGAVRRADDAPAGVDLLDSVCAPARNARDGEERCVQLLRNAQHLIDEAGVHIHVCADLLALAQALGERAQTLALDVLHELEVGDSALALKQLARVFLEQHRARIADGVDRVAQTIDLAAADVGLLVEDFLHI